MQQDKSQKQEIQSSVSSDIQRAEIIFNKWKAASQADPHEYDMHMLQLQKRMAKLGYKYNIYLINKSVLKIQHFYMKQKINKLKGTTINEADVADEAVSSTPQTINIEIDNNLARSNSHFVSDNYQSQQLPLESITSTLSNKDNNLQSSSEVQVMRKTEKDCRKSRALRNGKQSNEVSQSSSLVETENAADMQEQKITSENDSKTVEIVVNYEENTNEQQAEIENLISNEMPTNFRSIDSKPEQKPSTNVPQMSPEKQSQKLIDRRVEAKNKLAEKYSTPVLSQNQQSSSGVSPSKLKQPTRVQQCVVPNSARNNNNNSHYGALVEEQQTITKIRYDEKGMPTKVQSITSTSRLSPRKSGNYSHVSPRVQITSARSSTKRQGDSTTIENHEPQYLTPNINGTSKLNNSPSPGKKSPSKLSTSKKAWSIKPTQVNHFTGKQLDESHFQSPIVTPELRATYNLDNNQQQLPLECETIVEESAPAYTKNLPLQVSPQHQVRKDIYGRSDNMRSQTAIKPPKPALQMPTGMGMAQRQSQTNITDRSSTTQGTQNQKMQSSSSVGKNLNGRRSRGDRQSHAQNKTAVMHKPQQMGSPVQNPVKNYMSPTRNPRLSMKTVNEKRLSVKEQEDAALQDANQVFNQNYHKSRSNYYQMKREEDDIYQRQESNPEEVEAKKEEAIKRFEDMSDPLVHSSFKQSALEYRKQQEKKARAELRRIKQAHASPLKGQRTNLSGRNSPQQR